MNRIPPKLTPRKVQILELRQTLTPTEIAKRLGLSKRSIDLHLQEAYIILDKHDAAHAIKAARDLGYFA